MTVFFASGNISSFGGMYSVFAFGNLIFVFS